MNPSRRSFIKALAGVGAASLTSAPLFRAFADPTAASDEFFIFIHALGGWDVTLGLDPRWEKRGLVQPASTANSDVSAIRNWTNGSTALDDGSFSFVPITPSGTPFTFGPTLGNLLSHASRLTVFNGLATNTVSHPDGQTYAVTGRHLNGGRPNQSSIDCCVASELGGQLLPAVSVQYPSYLLGPGMDARATPLRVSNIGTLAKSLTRSALYESPAERDAVGMMLSAEADDLADISLDPTSMHALSLQYQSVRNLLARNLQQTFSAQALAAAHPELDIPKLKFQSAGAVNTAFALEALRQNIARCVSFTFTAFDTHFSNYRTQALVQQETFDTIAAMLDQLDAIAHPTRTGDKLSDHTHILVTSDFCRTPQINVGHGRDHYPNGSAIVISPKYKGNTLFGKSDPDQLLPANAGNFSDGPRPCAPPDVLATFISAFGIDPRKFFREGEVIAEVLK